MASSPPAPRSRRRLLAAAVVLLALAASAAAYVIATREPGPYNVLLVTVDTLRASRLSFMGETNGRETSPALDALAASGAVFETAYAPRGCTWPSLTTILTGKYPIIHGVRSNGEALRAEHRTLAEILKAEGYATGAFLTNMTSAPNRGFDELAVCRDFMRPHFEWDRTAVRRATEFVRKNADERFFAWIHLMDPHEPYLPPPPFDRWAEGYAGPFSGQPEPLEKLALDPSVPFGPEDEAAMIALYDGQIASTDRYLKKLFATLDELGLSDETLVVFTSDHGEELFDHNRYFFHAASIYDGVLRVPLVFRLGGAIAAGRRTKALVELTDVLPTVLDFLDLPRPAWIQGETLRPVLDGDRPERRKDAAFFEWSPPDKHLPQDVANRIFAVRRGKWKLISNPNGLKPWNRPYDKSKGEGFALDRLELYDLDADPGETRNLAGVETAVTKELFEKLGVWLAEMVEKAGASDEASAESQRQLEQLGYIAPKGDPERDGGTPSGGKPAPPK